MSGDARQSLSFDEAVALLPPEGRVHTFVQVAHILVGAHWDREAIYDEFRRYGAELSGAAATAMKHGIVVLREYDAGGPLFVETRD